MPYDKTKDKWAGQAQSLTEQSRNAVQFEPADSDFAIYPKAIYVGTGGDLYVIPLESTTEDLVPYMNWPGGTYFELRVRRVAASTTASDLVAEY